MNGITIERLNEVFFLDKETGRLFWRINIKRAKAGTEAGFTSTRGYRIVGLDGVGLKAHRIILAMTNGRWPTNQTDHVNGIKSDDRPCNLREATCSENRQNTGIQRNNASGQKGVYWDRPCQKWRAQIYTNKRKIYLGVFDDLEMAGYAYMSASLKYHGTFARTI